MGRCHSLGENIFFQTSWFVAWLSLDQHRIEMRKHGIIPCVTVEKVFNFLEMTFLSRTPVSRYSCSGIRASDPSHRKANGQTSDVALCLSPRLLSLQGAATQPQVDLLPTTLLSGCCTHNHRRLTCLWNIRLSQHCSKVRNYS